MKYRCSDDISRLEYGDLIYWSGHVAIYLGPVNRTKIGVSDDFDENDNIGIMHARNYGAGVNISSLDWEGSGWDAYYVVP